MCNNGGPLCVTDIARAINVAFFARREQIAAPPVPSVRLRPRHLFTRRHSLAPSLSLPLPQQQLAARTEMSLLKKDTLPDAAT